MLKLSLLFSNNLLMKVLLDLEKGIWLDFQSLNRLDCPRRVLKFLLFANCIIRRLIFYRRKFKNRRICFYLCIFLEVLLDLSILNSIC